MTQIFMCSAEFVCFTKKHTHQLFSGNKIFCVETVTIPETLVKQHSDNILHSDDVSRYTGEWAYQGKTGYTQLSLVQLIRYVSSEAVCEALFICGLGTAIACILQSSRTFLLSWCGQQKSSVALYKRYGTLVQYRTVHCTRVYCTRCSFHLCWAHFRFRWKS